jgi:hypothetical protein
MNVPFVPVRLGTFGHFVPVCAVCAVSLFRQMVSNTPRRLSALAKRILARSDGIQGASFGPGSRRCEDPPYHLNELVAFRLSLFRCPPKSEEAGRIGVRQSARLLHFI